MENRLNKFRNSFRDEYNLYYPEHMNDEKEYDLILKILPEPVSRIYSGVKKFELRKYVPRHSGIMFLLETGNLNAISGCFYFNKYISDTVPNIWKKVGEKATKKYKFDKYFRGKDFGVAIEIIDFEKFDKPIFAEDIYSKFPYIPRLPNPYVYMYTPVKHELSNFLREKAKNLIERNNL